ncbi:MAG: hypothetical protein KGJ02_06305 [Verrucomicrobiota bacterium]|nr:hypothetical protein [Verrucomicrobiota bacterium]
MAKKQVRGYRLPFSFINRSKNMIVTREKSSSDVQPSTQPELPTIVQLPPTVPAAISSQVPNSRSSGVPLDPLDFEATQIEGNPSTEETTTAETTTTVAEKTLGISSAPAKTEMAPEETAEASSTAKIIPTAIRQRASKFKEPSALVLSMSDVQKEKVERFVQIVKKQKSIKKKAGQMRAAIGSLLDLFFVIYNKKGGEKIQLSYSNMPEQQMFRIFTGIDRAYCQLKEESEALTAEGFSLMSDSFLINLFSELKVSPEDSSTLMYNFNHYIANQSRVI